MAGTIYPKETIFFREAAGTCVSTDDVVEYELTTAIGAGSPIVRSSKTGKWFTLCWDEIVKMAVDAGIDIPDENTKK